MKTIENLKRLLDEANQDFSVIGTEDTAKYLANRNTTVLPCKINQTVYQVTACGVTKELVTAIIVTGYGFNVRTTASVSNEYVFGIDVFTSDKDANAKWRRKYSK